MAMTYVESLRYLYSLADFERTGRFADRKDVEPVRALPELAIRRRLSHFRRRENALRCSDDHLRRRAHKFRLSDGDRD